MLVTRSRTKNEITCTRTSAIWNEKLRLTGQPTFPSRLSSGLKCHCLSSALFPIVSCISLSNNCHCLTFDTSASDLTSGWARASSVPALDTYKQLGWWVDRVKLSGTRDDFSYTKILDLGLYFRLSVLKILQKKVYNKISKKTLQATGTLQVKKMWTWTHVSLWKPRFPLCALEHPHFLNVG